MRKSERNSPIVVGFLILLFTWIFSTERAISGTVEALLILIGLALLGIGIRSYFA